MMDEGGKTENVALNQLIQELETFLHLTSQNVEILNKNISNAREVLSLSTSIPTHRNESKEPLDESFNPIGSCTENLSIDEEDLLEGEITRILKVAENVRDKSMPHQGCKIKPRQMSSSENKLIKNYKNEGICSTGIKDLATTHRGTSTSSKTPRKPIVANTLKTTYQKDFSLAKAKSLPSLCRLSKSTKTLSEISEKNPHERQYKDLATASATSAGNSKSSASSKKDFVKINAQKVSLPQKKNSRMFAESKRTSKFLSLPLVSRNFEKSNLGEAIATKSQSPNCKEVLAALRDSYKFLNDSKQKTSKRETKLKEDFLNKCFIPVEQCETEPELETIFKSLLPHFGRAFGDRSFSSESNLNDVKDAVSKAEAKLENVLKDSHSDLGAFSISNEGPPESNSVNHENISSEEWFTQNSSVMSRTLHGIELPFCLYYSDVSELVSFQSTICELMESDIHLRLMKLIHQVILEYINSKMIEDKDSENNEKWKESLALLLKTAAAIADFTGHLTMPILAGTNAVTDSVPK